MALATTVSSGELSTVYCPGCIDTRSPALSISLASCANCGANCCCHGRVLAGLLPNGMRSELMRNTLIPFAALYHNNCCKAARFAPITSHSFCGVAVRNVQLFCALPGTPSARQAYPTCIAICVAPFPVAAAGACPAAKAVFALPRAATHRAACGKAQWAGRPRAAVLCQKSWTAWAAG